MSISIKNITISIGGTNSNKFKIKLDNALYHLDNFRLKQQLMQPVKLTFTLFKDPVEDINEPQFTVCGNLIGKEVQLTLQTEPIEKEIDNANTEGKTADIEFEGFITRATSKRIESQQAIEVEALSRDAVLIDHPRCQIFNEETLDNIVKAVYDEAKLDTTEVTPETEDTIFYTAQYNENHYDFLRRLARRHSEWFFSTGKVLHFGKIDNSETIQLAYPSQDIPDYGVRLQTFHPKFSYFGMGYNTIWKGHDYSEEFKEDTGNPLSDATFKASQDNYSHKTGWLPPATIESDADAEKDQFESPLFCQDQKAEMLSKRSNMLIYEGHTYCSRLQIGAKLNIKDNYISSGESNSKSDVQQDEILITEVVHTFKADEQYKNSFKGITATYPHPPYEPGPIHPICNHPVIADVIDTEDPKHWGRVRIRFPWLKNKHKEGSKNGMTPWVRVIQPYTMNNGGVHFIPEKYSQVFVDFEDGNFERPQVLGTHFIPDYPVDEQWYTGNNLIKALRTASGHTIEIHDVDGTDGGGFIKIYDNSSQAYELTLSTDDKLIKLKSKGNIALSADGDITLNAGHDIKMTAKNDMTFDAKQNLKVTATQMNYNAGQQIEVETPKLVEKATTAETTISSHTIDIQGKLNYTAGNISFTSTGPMTISSTSAMSLSSQAVLNLQGTVINMN